MRKLKVLMFGWEFPPIMSGGLGVACYGLCEAMAPMVDLKMIIPKSAPGMTMDHVDLIGMNNVELYELDDIAMPKNVEVNHIYTSLNPYSAFSKNYKYTKEAKYIRRDITGTRHFEIDQLYGDDVFEKVIEFSELASRMALTKKFDIIHAHDWMTFLAGMRLKAATGKPLVVHVHSLEYDRNGEESQNEIYHLEKRAMQEADAVIPVSRYTGRICERYYGIAREKIFPIHNASVPEYTHRNNHRFPEPVVLFLGRVTRQKGPEYFVATAQKVLAQIRDVRFVLAGAGNLMEETIERVAELGISDRFHFTGFLNKERVNELLAMTGVYVLPSLSEPFGLSALEAAHHEIPCIISERSGVSEVLHGSLKADFWEVDKMANYIIALIKSDKLRQQLVTDANENLKEISWRSTAEKITGVYERLLN
jgi:glycogen(starch) synthase